jgi:hypothetical protein
VLTLSGSTTIAMGQGDACAVGIFTSTVGGDAITIIGGELYLEQVT